MSLFCSFALSAITNYSRASMFKIASRGNTFMWLEWRRRESSRIKEDYVPNSWWFIISPSMNVHPWKDTFFPAGKNGTGWAGIVEKSERVWEGKRVSDCCAYIVKEIGCTGNGVFECDIVSFGVNKTFEKTEPTILLGCFECAILLIFRMRGENET